MFQLFDRLIRVFHRHDDGPNQTVPHDDTSKQPARPPPVVDPPPRLPANAVDPELLRRFADVCDGLERMNSELAAYRRATVDHGRTFSQTITLLAVFSVVFFACVANDWVPQAQAFRACVLGGAVLWLFMNQQSVGDGTETRHQRNLVRGIQSTTIAMQELSACMQAQQLQSVEGATSPAKEVKQQPPSLETTDHEKDPNRLGGSGHTAQPPTANSVQPPTEPITAKPLKPIPATLAELNDMGRLVNENEVYHDKEFGVSGPMYFNFYAGLNLVLEESDPWLELDDKQRGLFAQYETAVSAAVDAHKALERDDITMPDKFTLLRFLVADGFSVPTATKRMVHTLEWRRTKPWAEADRVTPPAKFKEFRAHRVRRWIGYDVKYRPVFVERLGKSMSAIAKHLPGVLSEEEVVDCYVYEFGQFVERFREVAVRTGKVQWKTSFIADMKNLNGRHAMKAISHFKSCGKEAEVHFPELAGRIFLPNIGVAAKFWPMAKRFLDPTVATKSELIQAALSPVMEEEIGTALLLPEHGGTSPVMVPDTPT